MMQTSDKIFLLSVEEYQKHRDAIPKLACHWWLRSPGIFTGVAYVKSYGYLSNFGRGVDDDAIAVRPAIRIARQESRNLSVGNTFGLCGCQWFYLGNGVAIAWFPIWFGCFDKEGNDYESSCVRRQLLDWYRNRKGLWRMSD